MTSYCLGFLFSHGMKDVVLLRKARPTWQAGKYNGIGGKIEDNEQPEEAMYREFKEEMGIESPAKWVSFGLLKCPGANVFLFYAELPKAENIRLVVGDGRVWEANKQIGEYACVFSLTTLPYMFRTLNGTRVSDFIPNIPFLVNMAVGMSYGDRTGFYIIYEADNASTNANS